MVLLFISFLLGDAKKGKDYAFEYEYSYEYAEGKNILLPT